MTFELRPATVEDDAFLAELGADVQAGELAAAGLPPEALAGLLAMQHRARTQGYAARFPEAQNSIVRSGHERVGRLLVNEDERELRLVDFAILAMYRGHGIGTELLRILCERAAGSGKPLRLSVRAGSPAIRLYQRAGFVVTAVGEVDLEMEFRAAGGS